MHKQNALVSIIITTKNEEKNIKRLLTSLTEDTYPNKEILLIDNHSTDNTLAIAKKHPVSIFTFGPERSAQRNFGAKKAKGEYLLFLDADMEVSSHVVSACVAKIQSNKQIGGIVIPEISIGKSYWEKVKAFERSFYNEKGDAITDAARFFPKKIFEQVGGYDKTITGPEDWDLSETIRKKGYIIERITAQIYHHEYVPSLSALVKKKYYYGLRAHTYMGKHNVSVGSAKTLYFLRPVFYQQWRKYIQHPLLFLGMVYMLTLELCGGGMGYLTGKVKKL